MGINDISKAIQRKNDEKWRVMANDQSPVIVEAPSGVVYVSDPSVYTQAIAQGKNITISTAGNIQTINAVMGLLEGSNISISSPDIDGKVTITGTIGGKQIDLTGLTEGYVLTYDLAADKFIVSALPDPYTLPQAIETALGGIKAKVKTSESSEVAIDTTTGKLYVRESGISGGAALPTASVDNRGQIYTVFGDTGIADVSYICLKDASDTYNWIAL
jgi:hypothetical protein